jgi:hypothetical protein
MSIYASSARICPRISAPTKRRHNINNPDAGATLPPLRSITVTVHLYLRCETQFSAVTVIAP